MTKTRTRRRLRAKARNKAKDTETKPKYYMKQLDNGGPVMGNQRAIIPFFRGPAGSIRGRSAWMTPEIEYLKCLHNPWEVRGVRIPSRFPAASQVSTFHGLLNFTTNAAGFSRLSMFLYNGSVAVWNDVTHSDVLLGSQTTLLNPLTPSNTSGIRLVSAGLKVRSLASFSTDAGTIHAYSALASASSPYDYYRDQPHQHLYSKGQVAHVVYIPPDERSLSFDTAPLTPWGVNPTIGVMITGAPTTTYAVQYAWTVEYMSNLNTDSIPHRLALDGDAAKAVSAVKSHNHANPSTWSFAGAGQAIRGILTSAIGAIQGYASGGVAGALVGASGYHMSYPSLPSGNRAITY